MENKFLAQPPVDDFGLRKPDYIFGGYLPATGGGSPDANRADFTVPGNQKRYKAVFRSSAPVLVAINETQVILPAPVANVLAASVSELSPACREVDAGDVISLLSRTANNDVTVSLYAIEQ